MPGQGTIVGVGSIDYPASYLGADPATHGRPRRLEGRHAHLHLRPPHHPGRRVRPLPPEGAGAAARRRRLLRRRLPLARRALRGRAVAPRRQPGRPRGGHAGQAGRGRHAHPRAPRAGPPHRRPRPAGLEGAGDGAGARSGHLRAHHLGPRPRVPHRRHRRRRPASPSATSSARCATPTAARSASSTCTSRSSTSSAGSRSRSRARHDELGIEDKRHILAKLNAAEAFEEFLATKYVGQKRFGLQGAESAIPILDAVLEAAADADLDGVVMGMAHRGRLNVLTNIVGKSYGEVFKEFDGVRRPGDHPGLRRREVPPRPGRQVRQPVGQGGRGRAVGQPEPPRDRRPHRGGHGPRQAGPDQRARQLLGHAAADPRRLRLRRPGRGGRDPAARDDQGLPRGRHHPPHHQQPARASPRRPSRPAAPSTAPTWPRWCRRRSST